jgi:hypothetical protein
MAYVPGFEWDIFLSYPMEAEAWAKQFEEHLRDGGRLAAARGLRIYFAHRDWRLGGVSDDMLEAARRSAIFVAVITADSLFQDEMRFLQREMEAFRQSGPLKGRFCPVALEPVEPSDISRAMPVASPHAFWSLAKFYFYDRGTPLWLEPDIEPERGYYKREVRRTAHQLRELLDKLAPDAKPASDVTGAFSGRTVFLARIEPNSQILTEWEDIRRLLINDGATVLPNEKSKSDDAAIQSAELFVQLLSPRDNLSSAKTQFELARSRNIPLLQWRRKDSNLQVDPAVSTELDAEDEKLCHGANVQTGSLEDFKNGIREELDKIRAGAEKVRERNEESATPAAGSGRREKPYLYITADTVDLPLALELQARARKRAVVDVMDQDETQRPSDFLEGLKQASAMLFLYGETTPQFVDRWIKRYIRESRSLNIHPKIAALYLAPPERKEGEEPQKPFDELRTLGSHKQFTPQEIEGICAELCGDPV